MRRCCGCTPRNASSPRWRSWTPPTSPSTRPRSTTPGSPRPPSGPTGKTSTTSTPPSPDVAHRLEPVHAGEPFAARRPARSGCWPTPRGPPRCWPAPTEGRPARAAVRDPPGRAHHPRHPHRGQRGGRPPGDPHRRRRPRGPRPAGRHLVRPARPPHQGHPGHRPHPARDRRPLRGRQPAPHPDDPPTPHLRLPLVHPTRAGVRRRPRDPPQPGRPHLRRQSRPALPTTSPPEDQNRLDLPDPRHRHLALDRPPPPHLPPQPQRHPNDHRTHAPEPPVRDGAGAPPQDAPLPALNARLVRR